MRRIPQLDGVRGCAILMVLLYHCVQRPMGQQDYLALGLVRASLGLMWSGVDLFFVLSGFLIASILLDNAHASNYFKAFYVRRGCRILPLYVVVVAGYFLFRNFGRHDEFYRVMTEGAIPGWSYATFTQNLAMGWQRDWGCSWLSVTWSLAVEEQFYLLMPIVVRCIRGARLAALLGSVALAAPLLRAAFPGFHAFVNAPFRADSLLTGALLAIAIRYSPLLEMAQKYRRTLVALLAALVVGAAVASRRPAEFGAFVHTWLACLYVTLVLLAIVGGNHFIPRTLASRPMRWLGERSCALYLFHMPILIWCFYRWRHEPPPIGWWEKDHVRTLASLSDAGLVALAIALTCLAAEASYWAIERPFLRLGRRVSYRGDAVVPVREWSAQPAW
jgi:peptidoglycan/LPS O-acetylase OafA/YrhL